MIMSTAGTPAILDVTRFQESSGATRIGGRVAKAFSVPCVIAAGHMLPDRARNHASRVPKAMQNI